MKTVNALKVRNNLGEILDTLTKTKEPILLSKGREIRAVLITPEQFKERFLDFQAEEQKKELFKRIKDLRLKSKNAEKSIDILRELRGYSK
ncbi:MAG: type II toxin-antitoxin system Phd/YefM family antitoxin [bacterium]